MEELKELELLFKHCFKYYNLADKKEAQAQFASLIKSLEEQLLITDVSQRRKLLFALLDWIDYGNKEDKEHIIDTFLKDIHSK